MASAWLNPPPRSRLRRAAEVVEGKAALKCQCLVRGFLSKCRVRKLLEAETRELVLGSHATYIQKMFRAAQGRKRVRAMKRNLASRFIQRVYRGHLGRCVAARERQRLETLRKR